MNEPFLLSNLIDLQEIDNEIYNIESQKGGSENVVLLKELELQYNRANKDLEEAKNSLSGYFIQLEKDELDTKDTKHVDKITYIETGVVATYIMLASENKGLATGLCECIRNRDVIAKKIGREGSKVILIIGVGIPNGKQTYFDPRVSKERNIPYRRNPYKVPNFESIFNIQ